MFSAYFLFLLRKHFITEKFYKKKSGDVNDEANFSLFILLHKRAKPILPPLPTPSLPRANSNPLLPPYPHPPPTHPPIPHTLTLRPPMVSRFEQKISLQQKRCNYKTNSSVTSIRHKYADV